MPKSVKGLTLFISLPEQQISFVILDGLYFISLDM